MNYLLIKNMSYSEVSSDILYRAWELANDSSTGCISAGDLMQSILEVTDTEIIATLHEFNIKDEKSLSNKILKDVKKIRSNYKKIDKEIDIDEYCEVTNKLLLNAQSESKITVVLEEENLIQPIHLFVAFLSVNNELSHILDKYGLDYQSFVEVHHDLMFGNHTYIYEDDFTNQPKEKQLTSAIATYCDNINYKVYNLKKNPLIGREKELELTVSTLCRKDKHNVIYVGQAGVGKTAMVDGLAWEIQNGNVPLRLKSKMIFSLNLTKLLAGTKYRGDMEKRLDHLLTEVANLKNAILFIDEIHTLVGAGSSTNGLDILNILKPKMARDGVQIIGATTHDEYENTIQLDKAFDRRLNKITIYEPSLDECEHILNKVKASYQSHHNVKYSNKIIKQIVHLSNKHITDRQLPDKAFDILDELGTINNFYLPKKHNYTKTLSKFRNCQVTLLQAIKDNDVSVVQQLDSQQKKLIEKINNYHIDIPKKYNITSNDVYQVIANKINVPVEQISSSMDNKLLTLNDNLNSNIINQSEAIKTLTDTLKINRLGLSNEDKPIGSFLCIGSSGVGKTKLAKELSTQLFSHNKILKLNMSEYNNEAAISKLLGTTSGYIGYEESSVFSSFVRNNLYSVILIDEFEKAHKSIHNIFLSILDDGECLDGRGRLLDFRNTILIFTSNIGSKQTNSVGYGNNNIQQNKLKELEKKLPLELINRFDSVITFNNLTKDSLEKILDIEIQKILNKIKCKLTIKNETKDKIIGESLNDKYGARLLERNIKKYILLPLSEQLLNKKRTITI